MREERYLYPDRVLVVKEYNGQLIFKFEHYESYNRDHAAEDSGNEVSGVVASDC